MSLRAFESTSDHSVQQNRRVDVKDVILTLGLMLGAGLVCQLVADALRAPRMLLLLAGGVVLGPSVTTRSTSRSTRWAPRSC